MFSNEVVLEAMRVLCRDGIISLQTQEANVSRSSAADVSTALQQLDIKDLTHLVLCGTAPWTSYLAGAVQPVCLLDLGKDIKKDPKTGTITLEPKDPVWSEKHLDPRFNYDFSNLKDTKKYYRGGEEYKRPYGWQRFGLKVLDEYEDNIWLGNMRRETESVSGEWPVSYHGTEWDCMKPITEDNYKPGGGDRYGYGVYSTPEFEIAKDYATRFSCKGHNYKVIMQNRINPEYREIHRVDSGIHHNQKYYLVPIKDKTKEREIVQKAIRPYAFLLIKD